MHRIAYGYASLERGAPPREEQRLRWGLLEYARLEGLDLRRVFVDVRDEAFGFDALRGVLARRVDVPAAVLPDFEHVQPLQPAAGLPAVELGRLSGVAVRITTPPPPPPPAPDVEE